MEALNVDDLLKNKTLIIPEIQREYVWGASSNVLKSFIEDINRHIENEEINIGFLYSYTVNNTVHYIIDGQQRLTTLVLLLFYKSLDTTVTLDQFRELIKVNAPLMAFSYNVRPLTEVFLRQLFKHNCRDSNIIKRQKWYLEDYNEDITIQSILKALDLFSQKGSCENLTYEQVTSKIKFWYFDVKQTSQGEELYITMNSRGKKLTNSEQIKPHLFSQLNSYEIAKFGKLWDNWEEYFYTNRPKESDKNVMVLVDDAMNNFIKIASELTNLHQINDTKPNDVIKLPELEKWFLALEAIPMKPLFQKEIKRLFETNEDARYYVLKSLLSVAYKGIKDEREFERVRQSIRNALIRKTTVVHIPLLNMLDLFRKSEYLTFYEFILSGVNVTGVFDENDLIKFKIVNKFNTIHIEDLFWNDEHHCIWNGDISVLITWSTNNNGIFDFNKYSCYSRIFNHFFPSNEDNLKKDDNLDLIRRALLARHTKDYPRHFRNSVNSNFCYTSDDWKTLFSSNLVELKEFFTEIQREESPEFEINKMIDNYQYGEDYCEFVKDEKLLEFTELKNIRWIDGTLYLFKRQQGARANIHAYKYYLMLKKTGKEFGSGWELNFWTQGESCVFYNQVTQENKLISIDMIWNTEKDRSKMEIDCFMKKNNKNNFTEEELVQYTWEYLRPVGESLGYVWMDGRYRITIDQPDDEQLSFAIMDNYRIALLNKIKELDL